MLLSALSTHSSNSAKSKYKTSAKASAIKQTSTFEMQMFCLQHMILSEQKHNFWDRSSPYQYLQQTSFVFPFFCLRGNLNFWQICNFHKLDLFEMFWDTWQPVVGCLIKSLFCLFMPRRFSDMYCWRQDSHTFATFPQMLTTKTWSRTNSISTFKIFLRKQMCARKSKHGDFVFAKEERLDFRRKLMLPICTSPSSPFAGNKSLCFRKHWMDFNKSWVQFETHGFKT